MFDAKVKVVCASCNNGWMNDLEAGVRSLLPKMIKGRSAQLTKTKQRALATWSLKTIMMLKYTHSKEDRLVIPDEDYAALFQDRQPSQIMRIWTAAMTPPVALFGAADHPVDYRCVPLNGDVTIQHTEGAEFLRANAYVTTLRIGYFVTQVIRIGTPGLLYTVTPSPALGKHLTPIWPNIGTREWPPPSLDKIGGLATLANALAS
ncbi:hypothetical protein [Amycolatopsis sp. NPDC051102]|uniref:hypothetical protein n=1 Tax=Amycolatopsis sp. NPDC051102 TaxID=3155163 RepID=UPI0034121A9D